MSSSGTYPLKLFRYRPATGEHFKDELTALTCGCIWMSPLDQQNDPYEGRPTFDRASL